jgi:hypothetical protein
VSASGEQPPPRPSTAPPLWPEVIALAESEGLSPAVIADMRERDQFGRDRYGTALRRDNGRDFGVDAYQELLDACPYLAGAFGAHDHHARQARILAAAIRERLAPCGACGSLRTPGTASCSRCGATCP